MKTSQFEKERQILKARELVRKAEMNMAKVVRRCFPVGSEIHLVDDRVSIHATILDHGYGEDHVFIENACTGKQYWTNLLRFFHE